MADDESSYSSSETSYPSPAQEYFPVPVNSKAPEILASFKADLPPIYKADIKKDFYTRNVVKIGKFSLVKDLTIRPDRSLPINPLSTWRDLTPDIKLPDIRHRTLGDIYYTRGKLGQKLHRSKPDFDISDPVNKRKVLDIQKYSALHDPHCKRYFNRPAVVKHLKKQKLINDKNEVLCDVNEFNQYRSYLGELFNDQVKRRIEDNNAMEEMERDLKKAICAKQYGKQREAHKAYQLKHRRINLEYQEAIKNRHRANMLIWSRKLQQIDRYRAQVKLANTGTYTMKHWNAYLTRQKAANAEERRKQHTLIRIAYAETKNDYVTKYDKFVRLALFERYKADQAAAMIARDDQIDDMEQLVEETLKRARKSWLTKYDGFIEHCRENPLSHYQYLMKAQLRKKYLMRKYFYKWINYVLLIREQRPDENHQSTFKVDKRLRPYVESLKEMPKLTEQDHNKGCGDFECQTKTKKLKRVAKFTKIPGERSGDQMIPHRHATDAPTAATIENVVAGSRSSIVDLTDKREKKRKKVQSKIDKGEENDDGNDADVEEPDDFIDKMVARYKLDQEKLKKRLETIPPASMPIIGNRNSIPKRLLSVHVAASFDSRQEDQQETIAFLTDVNRATSSHDTLKGWKAMKL